MMEIDTLQQEVSDWLTFNWPNSGDEDVFRCIAKTAEEFGELCRAIIRGEDVSVIEDEGADVLITLCALMTRANSNLAYGIDKKWPVVQGRDPHARHQPEKSDKITIPGWK